LHFVPLPSESAQDSFFPAAELRFRIVEAVLPFVIRSALPFFEGPVIRLIFSSAASFVFLRCVYVLNLA
jgi:hypothetical protein